jgi:copper transport protein
MTIAIRPPRRRAFLPATVLALILVVLTLGAALAHANLVRSDPPANAALPKAPAQIQLWFSEELEPSFSQAIVYNAQQQQVDNRDSHVAPNDPLSLIVTLPANLPNGTYVIAWTTQSKVDGHIVRGVVPFGVGVASVSAAAAASAPVENGAVSGSPAEMALRWLSLLAAIGLVGTGAFWELQRRALAGLAARLPSSAGDGGSTAPGAASRATWLGRGQRLAAIGVFGLFILSNLALIVLQASTAASVGFLAALGAPLLRTLATQYGELWLIRLALGLTVGAALAVRARSARSLAWPGLLLGGALILSISLSSHSAALGSLTPLGIFTDWLHFGAVAIWIGGLTQLAVLVAEVKLPLYPRPLPSRGGEGVARPALLLATLVPRFSILAGISLGVVGVTGVGEALFHVGTLDNLLNTAYGQALLVKTLLVLPIVAIAAVHHFVFVPVFQRSKGAATAGALGPVAGLVGVFRWTARLELLFAVAAIAAAGVMTSLSPAIQPNGAGGGTLNANVALGDLNGTFALAPGRPGPNSYQVTLSGPVQTDVQRVSVQFTFLDSNLGTTEVVLNQSGPNQYTGSGSDVALAGRWQAEVIVRRAGRDDVQGLVGFEANANGAQPLTGQSLTLTWAFYVGLLIVVLGLLSLARGAVLRRQDLRRAAVVAVCGLGLVATGGGLALRDVQQAEAQSAAALVSLQHPPTAASIADGQVVFQQNCARCHGLDARGDGPLAPSLNPRPSDLILHVPLHTDADLENWIANGFPGSAMPAFQDQLTEDQRWDVLNYLKQQVSNASQSAAK